MSSGSSFQMLAPATGNDHLPNVVRRKNGTVKRLDKADLSLCRLGTSTTRVMYATGVALRAKEMEISVALWSHVAREGLLL